MRAQTRTGRTWLAVTPLFLLLLVLGSSSANAQHHADGSAWIDRDASEATQVHMPGDPLCLVEFPEQCFGGMMAPDSLLCELELLPENQWPEQCPIAIECVVTDPDGQHMLDGTGMHGDMMRSDVTMTVHYSPDSLAQLGMSSANLGLGIWDGADYVISQDAIHDPVSATFTLSTRIPGARYAVISRITVDAVPISWSQFKARH